METQITGSLSGLTFEGEEFDIFNTDKSIMIEDGVVKIIEDYKSED